MKVTILAFDGNIASARHRAQIPARELGKLGVELATDAEIVICSKHGWDQSLLDRYKKVVYDICDDHFASPHADFYRAMCARADLVTCNSDAMRFRIFQETGRVARVIDDPYEFDEAPPSWGEGLTWFGHESNLQDLYREAPRLQGYRLHVVSTPVAAGITPWSPETVLKALQQCAVVIIPTGRSACKSANRLVEAVRRGKFVVANPLPAYEEFASLMWVGDLREGVDYAHAHREQCLERVAKCQAYVRERFSPERIGRMWAQALSSLG